MTHYETLGVAKDASPEEIKAAFRRKASAAHPDRDGGSKEAMAAINRAYGVLGDPERRARYDETGSDADQPTVHSRAIGMLAEFFTAAIEREGDMLAHVRQAIQAIPRTAEADKLRTQADVQRLTRRREKIQTKSGENIVHQIVDARLVEARRRIEAAERAQQIANAALAMLDDYESTEEGRARDPFEQIAAMHANTQAWQFR